MRPAPGTGPGAIAAAQGEDSGCGGQDIARGDRVKRCIRAAQSFALGENPAAMSDSQVMAGLGLLNKTMPDLAEVSVSETEGRLACSETENE